MNPVRWRALQNQLGRAEREFRRLEIAERRRHGRSKWSRRQADQPEGPGARLRQKAAAREERRESLRRQQGGKPGRRSGPGTGGRDGMEPGGHHDAFDLVLASDDSESVVDLIVGDALRDAAAEAPDAIGLVEGVADPAARRRWSYADLLEASERAARALLGRFVPGDRVAVWANNIPEWVILELGRRPGRDHHRDR